MKNYKQQLDTLFNKAQKASAGTRLLSGDDIRNLLADSADVQTTTTRQGVRPMIIASAATGLVALITTGIVFFSPAPHTKQPAAKTSAVAQQPRDNKQPMHYSTPGIAGSEKSRVNPAAGISKDAVHNNVPDVSNENSAIDLRGVRMLELTDAELLNLGIEHQNDDLNLYERLGKNSVCYLGITPTGTRIDPNAEQKPNITVLPGNHLRMVTDDIGNRRINKYTDDNDRKDDGDQKKNTTSSATVFLPNHDNMAKSTVLEMSGTGSDKKTIERPATEEEIRNFTEQQQQRKELDNISAIRVHIEKWIAIVVKSKTPYTVEDSLAKRWRPSYVLWYEPAPEVVAALPDRYRSQIERELKFASTRANDGSISAPNPNKGGFIGEWQTESGAITQSSVYPNPIANHTLTLSYTLSSPRNVKISLRSITGAVVSELAMEKQQAGTWAKEYTLGEVRPGMYLVSIETDNGEYSVQRVIVE